MVKNNEYLNCFGMIVFLMKLFGVFPFVSLSFQRGNFSKNITSTFFSKILTVCSLLTYFVVLSIHLSHQYQHFINVFKHFNIIFFTCMFPIITFRIGFATFPLILWKKSEELYLYWDKWMHFQIEVEKLTGSPFQSAMKNVLLGVNLIGVSGICVAGMMVDELHAVCLAPTPHHFAKLYMGISLFLIFLYWFSNQLYAKQMAKQINNLARVSVLSRKSVDLRRVIDLWMELCDLNKRFSDIHSVLFLLFFGGSVMDTTAHIYLAVLLLISDPNKSIGLSSLYVACFNIACVISFCEPAHSFSNHIKGGMRKVLLNENTTDMNQALTRMILLFLRTIETRNPQVDFYGYLTVNRSTVPMIFSTVINYLIILKQLIQVERGNAEEAIN